MTVFPINDPLIPVTWNDTGPSNAKEMDEAIDALFRQTCPWGIDTAIDLQGCNGTTIRDSDDLRTFAVDLCHCIKMRRYGEPQMVRFGEEPRVRGITLVQLIETSSIVAHFIEQTNAACLNIFSCTAYPPYQTAAWCQRWFQAQQVRVSVLSRGPFQLSGEET
jgi:S-adenosylmethionine/arginine decarboxylase-like enzyme